MVKDNNIERYSAMNNFCAKLDVDNLSDSLHASKIISSISSKIVFTAVYSSRYWIFTPGKINKSSCFFSIQKMKVDKIHCKRSIPVSRDVPLEAVTRASGLALWSWRVKIMIGMWKK